MRVASQLLTGPVVVVLLVVTWSLDHGHKAADLFRMVGLGLVLYIAGLATVVLVGLLARLIIVWIESR